MLEFDRNRHVDAGVLQRMCDIMAHRGPDDDGIFVDGPVGLGMRRLSIIDVAAGHQPLSNEDGTVWIVFNGEIYNHAALRPDLEARGHQYRTHCDTETIVHLYEEYGRDCVRRLRGMFAFAIWDARRSTLLLARDRLGIKPLYYRLSSEAIAFGSEIKVILAASSTRAAFRRAALPEYLAFGYLSEADTFYEGIQKLMPGHTMQLSAAGEMRIERYWELEASRRDAGRSSSYYVQGYRERLEEAVSSHLMSDVPLGVFLSGGVDSSAVAALMTQIRREPIETFSVGYAEPAYSELPYARIVADHLKSVHHEVLLTRQQFFDALPKLIWHEDEPIVWPSSVALYFVARLARERVTVVLTGEGSDETLGGYSRYAFTLKNAALDRVYRKLVPAVLRDRLRQSIASSPRLGATLRRKLSHTFLARDGASWASLYFDNFLAAFGQSEQQELLHQDFLDELPGQSPYSQVLQYWEQSAGETWQRLLYTDIKTYLVELLMKQDNMSMAASVESRVPFLDHPLVEFALTIPRQYQMQGMSGKAVLKKALEDLLPRSILYRPKLGFPTPWSGWLAGAQLDAIQSLLLDGRSLERGYFRRVAIERLLHEHRAKVCDHYDRIWRLLNLELWHRVCLEGESHNTLTDAAPLASAV